MIKEVTMYTVICDNCGADVCENQDFSCWNDKEHTKDMAMESGWNRDGDKHYCPECFTYDDDDNVILNNSRKNLNQK